MAVVIIKIFGSDGTPLQDDIQVEGNCMQHVGDPLLQEAVTNLVQNRWTLENKPWLYGVINDQGMAEEDATGAIAIAFWADDKYKFKPREHGVEDTATRWGTPPTKG